MRRLGVVGVALAIVALASPGATPASPDVGGPDVPLPIVPLAECPPSAAPRAAPGPAPLPPCPAAIRPGAASNMCTLNFVVTDGVDLYIGAAGHCAGIGRRLQVAGVPGAVGTVVLQRNQLLAGDWAFIRIDPEDRPFVDPTMCRFAGPFAGPTGVDARAPLPGEVVLHYGHGVALGAMEETRGRAGVSVVSTVKYFIFAGSVAGGDSGSPVRLATGEAAGIAVATVVPGYAPNAVFATRFDAAMADLAASLGRPVTLVRGEPLPALPL